jgi:hypothetical protein
MFIVLIYQAAAYYYHGLILDEGNTEKSHGMAVAALQAADEYFKESKKLCEAFNAATPLSRSSLHFLLLTVIILNLPSYKRFCFQFSKFP